MRFKQVYNLYKQDFRGRRFRQPELPLDLTQLVLGQRHFSRLFITLLLLLFCFVSVLFVCFLVASLGIDAVFNSSPYDCGNPLHSQLTIAVLVVWWIVALSQDTSKSVIAVGISIPTSIVIYSLIASVNKTTSPEDSLLSSAISVLFVWASTFLTYCLLRSVAAATDILFSSAWLAKGLLALTVFLSALMGSLSSLFSPDTKTQCGYESLPLWVKSFSIIFSIAWGMAILLGAWWVNHKRNVPWRSPDVFREWALIIGCRLGTSFQDLDLSGVSFRGAKLANTDLRARTLHRTCFQEATGLERSLVDNQYLDLDNPKVQFLLTHACCRDHNFQKVSLRGAYLQNADMRSFDLTSSNLNGADLQHADLREVVLNRAELAAASLQGVDLRQGDLTEANLTGSDLRGADLRDCILVRAQVARADFTGADMTGVCIEDWSVSSKTRFTNVRCDYIYRRYQDGQCKDQYPPDRNFELGEFASLYQQPENELELVFKGEFDYTALSLTFEKLQTDKPELGLRLKGIEQRENLWVVKVISDDPAVVETHIREIQDAVYQGYDVTTTRLENNPLIRRIISDVADIRKTQAETTEEVKQLAQRIGTNLIFLGSTIGNVTGQGKIEYIEASSQIRNFVASSGQETRAANTLLNQLTAVATTASDQTALIQWVLFQEAQRDTRFKQYLLQQGQQIIDAIPNSPTIASAIRGAIAQLNSEGSSNII